ncbi:unnamed protein product [Paramecium sonneborni]|uniref:PX domain-containing protein n=1 Tax=Paramecium sonneborni TaxID=65129 RepID=A0A8S1NTL0_9CILI|nr:unnamed protein product [Paramecium sonneborni]
MDQHHSKSFGAFNQLNSQLFKPKPLSFRLQIGPLPTEIPQVLKQGLVTPSTNDNDSNYSPSPQLRAFKSYRVSTEMLNGSPIDQIQLIIRENENLKKSLNQKQKIIETLTKSQKTKIRLDFNDLKKNSRFHNQPQSKQEAIKPKQLKQSNLFLKIIINVQSYQKLMIISLKMMNVTSLLLIIFLITIPLAKIKRSILNKQNYNHITTSQAIFDVIKRGNQVEETRIQFEIKCIGTEIEEAQMGKDVVKYKFTITKIDLSTGTKTSHDFVRRYTHFLWLQNELQNKQIGRVIPSLPDKQTVYDKDKRKIEFVYFMQKILSNKKLQQTDCLERFFSKELCVINQFNNLQDFDNFQHYIDNMKESQSMINIFINTGISFMNMFQKVCNYNSVQVLPRIPDENDKQLEEYKKDLELNKLSTEIIASDLHKIVQKLQIQARSLSNSFDIFSNFFGNDSE